MGNFSLCLFTGIPQGHLKQDCDEDVDGFNGWQPGLKIRNVKELSIALLRWNPLILIDS